VLRRIENVFVKITILADNATLVISFVFAYWLRSRLHVFGVGLPPFKSYVSVLSFILPAFIAWMMVFGLYRSASLRQPLRLIGSITQACVMGTLTVLSLLYMTRNTDLSRFVVDTFALMSVAGLSLERLAVRVLLNQRTMLFVHHQWQRAERRCWQVLLVAEARDAEAYLDMVRAHPHWGIEVAAIVNPARGMALGSAMAADGGGMQSVRYNVDWQEMLENYEIDEVVTVSHGVGGSHLQGLQDACAERGLTFRILVTMPEPQVGRYRIDDVGGGRYLVTLETVPRDPLRLAVKRIMDVMGALIGLAVCGVVYLWYARRLRRESPGPVLFTQPRTGRNGRVFQCHKFRTMIVDAERQQNELAQRSKLGPRFIKLDDDPRITPTGAFLRRYHLDEMPQFWNVLEGEMSLVGPRPSQAIEVEKYNERQRRRLSMKPGMTGLFQVNGHRAVEDFDGVVELDCAYIDNWSLWLDVKLLWKTLATVVKADGL
jgi:exopolysaccharide biosynthesis polyprenyl glycosylphosphotransferase